jgi:hypothetical protein
LHDSGIKGEEMVSGEMPVPASQIKDRRSALIGNGLVEVLGGVLVLGCVFLGRNPPGTRTTITEWIFSGAVGAMFICPGLGSILCRRWGRALSLVLSWLWLIVGVHGTVLTWWLFSQLPARKDAPSELDTAFALTTFFSTLMFFVVIPGALVLFYSNKHVKATVERRDPHVRWTDKCPMPVLLTSMACAVAAAFLALTETSVLVESYLSTKSLLGVVRAQRFGDVPFLACMVLLGYVAWGAYRLSVRAWWCAVIGVVLCAISSETVTFFSPARAIWHVPYDLLYAAALLGYLLYVHRFFKQAKNRPQNGNRITDVAH